MLLQGAVQMLQARHGAILLRERQLSVLRLQNKAH